MRPIDELDMPVKRTEKKQAPPPQKANSMPHKGPYTAEEMFVPPKFTAQDHSLVAQPPYRCACCHKSFSEQKGNFYRTRSELYKANNGFVTVCVPCSNSYYEHAVVRLRDEHQALLHVAQMFDWYVSDEMIDELLADNKVKKPVGELAKKLNRTNAPEGSYLDALIDGVVAIAPEKEAAEAAETPEVKVDPRAEELFGIGYDPQEYQILLQHYEMLTKQFSNADNVQDSLIKDLCTTKLLQIQSRSDPDTYAKMTKLYQDTLKNGGLSSLSDNADLNDEKACFGVWKAQIEQYCPADIYLDDKLYDDVDSLKEYFERFILRPVINFFSGRRKLDEEYSLTPEEMNRDI